MVGLFQENGPCRVIEITEGLLGTQASDWGWDRSSNMLYIDQPNQVGFSYDITVNGSLDLLTGAITSSAAPPPANQRASTLLDGTFSSNNGNSTSNTTEIAAHAVWHMLQGFLGAFPQYNPGTKGNATQPGVVGVNLFAESYGGKYGPAFATHWEYQNTLRRQGLIPRNTTLEIQLSSLGILQGCIDDLVQGRYYPIFANNNTYGIQALSLIDEQTAANSFLGANGCQQLVQSCKNAAKSMDPSNDGDVTAVNAICQNAQETCNTNVIGPYQQSGRSVYDITQMMPDSFPPSIYLEYLNEADVQAAIGAMVNYTETNTAVVNAFKSTGDYERGDQISQMAYLLSLGIRVAMIYGDSDYICNWLGGEAVSFSIAAQSPALAPFYSAGYADIVVNDSYVGGAVRQFGNLSFSRIYDAGHLISAYQPETAFTVFTRIIMGTGISLGDPVDLTAFTTTGDANATHTNSVPPSHSPTCYIRNINNTCTGDQIRMLNDGDGSIINGVLYDKDSDWKAPASSIAQGAGFPGTIPSTILATPPPPSATASASATTTSEALTGFFVATTTPDMSLKKGAAARANSVNWISIFVQCGLFVTGAVLI